MSTLSNRLNKLETSMKLPEPGTSPEDVRRISEALKTMRGKVERGEPLTDYEQYLKDVDDRLEASC